MGAVEVASGPESVPTETSPELEPDVNPEVDGESTPDVEPKSDPAGAASETDPLSEATLLAGPGPLPEDSLLS
jgi:hypothetical protein